MKTTLFKKKMSALVMWCAFALLISKDGYTSQDTVVSFGSVLWITNSENSLAINKIPLTQQEEWNSIIRERVGLLVGSIYSSEKLHDYILDYQLPLENNDTYYLIGTPRILTPESLPALLIGIQVNNEGNLEITSEESSPTQMTNEWIVETFAGLKRVIQTKLDISKRDTGRQSKELIYQREKLEEIESVKINRLMLVYNPSNGLIDRYDPMN